MLNQCPWAKNIGHLAIVIDNIELGKWFFGEVLQASFYMYKGEQIMIEIGSSVLVAKLSKDAVDKSRQVGEFGKQVLDHYGFQGDSPIQVDLFFSELNHLDLKLCVSPMTDQMGVPFILEILLVTLWNIFGTIGNK